MESPPPPPLFVHHPQPPPVRKGGGLKWLWIVAAAVVVVVGGLVAISLPVYQSVVRKAEALKAKRLAAAKPRLPLSEEGRAAVDKFGDQVARAVKEDDSAFLATATDVEVMADRVLIPLGGSMDSDQARKGFAEGFKRNKAGIFAHLMGNEVKYLRQGERDGFPTVRLRVNFTNSTVTFVDILVTVDEKLNVRAADLFNFLYGSFATVEARNAMMAAMVQDPKNPLRAALGMKEYDAAKMESLSKIVTALRLGRVEQIVAEYDRLPPETQGERTFFLMYLQALSSLQDGSAETDKRYREALIKAPQLLGKESATDFLRVDLQFMDNDFAGAEESLRKTEDLVGRDAYLTHMRALMLLRQNKVDEAQKLEREAAKMEPGLLDLADLRLLIHAARKDHAALLNELRELKEKHQVIVRKAQLAGPEYEEFLKSPEFAKWEAENQ